MLIYYRPLSLIKIVGIYFKNDNCKSKTSQKSYIFIVHCETKIAVTSYISKRLSKYIYITDTHTHIYQANRSLKNKQRENHTALRSGKGESE